MASRFRNLYDSSPATASLDEILQEIRNTRPINSEAEKSRLPLYSPHAMTADTDASVIKHSGVMVFDIDALTEVPISNRSRIKQWLSKDEFVSFVYNTYKGVHFGVNVAISASAPPELHSLIHEAIRLHFQAAYDSAGFVQKVKWDLQVANIGRRMYIHGDPDIWVRKNPAPFLGHGNRNSQLTSLYGRYANHRQDAPDLIHRINGILLKPLSEHELSTIIDSVGRMQTSTTDTKNIRLHQQIDAIRSWLSKDLMYDVYQDRLIYKGATVSDELITKLRTELERETKITVPRIDFREFVNVVGEEQQYDWFKEWLEIEHSTYRWNHIDIGHAFIVCRHCKDMCEVCEGRPVITAEQAEWAGRWLQLIVDGVVGRNIVPGARFPYVPYILGSQGLAKSDMLKILASGTLTEEHYALVPDMEFYKGDIDTIYASQGVLIFEDGEAMVSARVQHNAQKRFATETVDRGLKKWKVIKSEKPRRYIVVVTSNERQHFPKGETRRFPVLDLPHSTRINTQWLIDTRAQLLRSRHQELKKSNVVRSIRTYTGRKMVAFGRRG